MPSRPWIWNRTAWPDKANDAMTTAAELAQARRLIGIVDGKAATLGFGRRPAAALEVQACEAQASTAIGGESFRRVVVRAVAARRHGLASLVASSRDVEDAVG